MDLLVYNWDLFTVQVCYQCLDMALVPYFADGDSHSKLVQQSLVSVLPSEQDHGGQLYLVEHHNVLLRFAFQTVQKPMLLQRVNAYHVPHEHCQRVSGCIDVPSCWLVVLCCLGDSVPTQLRLVVLCIQITLMQDNAEPTSLIG